jgi:hypothetical protein
MVAQSAIVAVSEGAVGLEMKGRSPADSADSSNEGMPLEQSSIIKPRIPATSSRDKVTSASMTIKTVVKNIQVRDLPSATSEPPAGFRMEAPRQIEVQPEAKELELGLTPERIGRLAPLAELQIRAHNLIVGSTTLDKDSSMQRNGHFAISRPQNRPVP